SFGGSAAGGSTGGSGWLSGVAGCAGGGSATSSIGVSCCWRCLRISSIARSARSCASFTCLGSVIDYLSLVRVARCPWGEALPPRILELCDRGAGALHQIVQVAGKASTSLCAPHLLRVSDVFQLVPRFLDSCPDVLHENHEIRVAF